MPTTPDNPEQQTKRGLPFPMGWVAVAVFAIVALIGGTVYVASLDKAPTSANGSEQDSAFAAEEATEDTTEEGSTLTTPFSEPGEFVGQDVSTSAKIEEVVDPNSFRIVSGSEDSLLVVYAGHPNVAKGMLVDVHGVMTEFERTAVEEQLAMPLQDELYELSSDDYSLVAHTVIVVKRDAGGTEVADAGDAAAAAPPVTGTTVASSDPVITSGGGTGEPASSAPAPSSSSGGGSSSGSENTSNSSGGSGDSRPSRPQSNESESKEISYTGDQTSGQHTDESEFEATLTDSDGDPVRDAKVVFTLKNAESSRDFKATTDRDGVATVTEELTERPGRYRLIVRHKERGSGKVLDETEFVIEKDDTALELTAEETKGDESEEEEGNNGHGGGNQKSTVLTAVLTEADDAEGLAGRTVDFYVDGQLIGSATTDAYGVAQFEFESKENQSSTFEARFSGDDYYLGSADSL